MDESPGPCRMDSLPLQLRENPGKMDVLRRGGAKVDLGHAERSLRVTKACLRSLCRSDPALQKQRRARQDHEKGFPVHCRYLRMTAEHPALYVYALNPGSISGPLP